jgi:hypothetical protein
MIGSKSGQIENYFPARAFGFIHSIEDGNLRRYFFHLSGVVAGVPVIGAIAVFDIDTERIKPGNPVLPVKNIMITPKSEVA